MGLFAVCLFFFWGFSLYTPRTPPNLLELPYFFWRPKIACLSVGLASSTSDNYVVRLCECIRGVTIVFEAPSAAHTPHTHSSRTV